MVSRSSKTLVGQGFRVYHLVDQIYQTRTGRSLGDRIPYNDYMRKKQVKPRMEADKLLQIASEGFDYLNTVWMMESSWSNVRSDIEHIVIFIDKYAKSLKKKNTTMQQLLMSNSSISNPIENGVSTTSESCDVNQVDPTFKPVDNLLADEDEHHPIFVSTVSCLFLLISYMYSPTVFCEPRLRFCSKLKEDFNYSHPPPPPPPQHTNFDFCHLVLKPTEKLSLFFIVVHVSVFVKFISNQH